VHLTFWTTWTINSFGDCDIIHRIDYEDDDDEEDERELSGWRRI